MRLESNALDSLRSKSGRILRLKTSDKTRIGSSTNAACPAGPSRPPRLTDRRLSDDSIDGFSTHGSHDPFAYMCMDNKPVLLGNDKELHDPHFVRNNWEMMSGDSLDPWSSSATFQTRPRSRRNTLTNSSTPSSRSNSETGHNSIRRKTQGSTSHTGLQVAGSILRDEESMLDSDSSSDEDDDGETHSNRLPVSPRRRPSLRQPNSPLTMHFHVIPSHYTPPTTPPQWRTLYGGIRDSST